MKTLTNVLNTFSFPQSTKKWWRGAISDLFSPLILTRINKSFSVKPLVDIIKTLKKIKLYNEFVYKNVLVGKIDA